MPKFTMVIEPEQKAMEYDWPSDEPPDLIYGYMGVLYVKVGHYAAAGNRYAYRRPTEAVALDGVLHDRKDYIRSK